MRIWTLKSLLPPCKAPLTQIKRSSSLSEAGISLKEKLLQDDHPRRVCHTYRALLRECTYLPDPSARHYLPKYIRWRFHKAAADKYDFSDRSSSKSANIGVRIAEKSILYLRRANAGHLSHLSLILSMTYGRTRARRHQLLSPLTIPVARIVECRNLTDIPALMPQLHALIRSQKNKPEASADRGPIRNTLPVIPEKNAWGRPMPLKRVKNMKKRWYADILHRIQAPLPRDEWETLRKRATGEIAWQGLIPRRAVAWTEHPTRLTTPKEERQEWQPHRVANGISRPRVLTGRTMRRLWNTVLVKCPTMEQAEDGKWKVHWSHAQEHFPIQMPNAAAIPPTIFDNVDEKGRKLTTPRSGEGKVYI